MPNTQGAEAPQAVAHDRWICDLTKNSREVYRFQLAEYRGHHLGNVRVFYKVDGSDELRPGKSGISIRVEKLADFQNALAKMIDAAKSEGLV